MKQVTLPDDQHARLQATLEWAAQNMRRHGMTPESNNVLVLRELVLDAKSVPEAVKGNEALRQGEMRGRDDIDPNVFYVLLDNNDMRELIEEDWRREVRPTT